jgi:hypothetical protein
VGTKGYDLARYSCSTIVDMSFGVRMLRALGLCACTTINENPEGCEVMSRDMHPTRGTRIPSKGLQSPLEGRVPRRDTGANKGSICRYNMLDSLLKASPLRALERSPQPSAWKVNSANFACTEFSEGRLLGVLSNSLTRSCITPVLLRHLIAGHLQRTRSGLCNVMAARSAQIGAPPNPISFPSGS